MTKLIFNPTRKNCFKLKIWLLKVFQKRFFFFFEVFHFETDLKKYSEAEFLEIRKIIKT